MIEGYKAVSKRELYNALINIRDKAYSNIDDDWIWMDDQTPLALYIDSVVSQMKYEIK